MNLNRLIIIAFVFTFPLIASSQYIQQHFSNEIGINVPDNSIADTYPSTIDVSGMPQNLSHIRVTLTSLKNNLGTSDFDILLEAPDGQKLTIFSDVPNYSPSFGGYDLVILDLDAQDILSSETYMNTETLYKPTNDGSVDVFGVLGEINNEPSFISLQNSNPNGEWKLYIQDDSLNGSAGSLSSWALTIEATDQEVCVRPEENLEVISVEGNTVDTHFPNHNSEKWDIFYTTEFFEEIPDYNTLPSIEDIETTNYQIIDLDYEQQYYIYYRVDCSGDNDRASRWVGPIMIETETGICAFAEDIFYGESVYFDNNSNAFINAIEDPCIETPSFARQIMYNFTPPVSGDFYLTYEYEENTTLESLALRAQGEDVTYCDSTQWNCISLDIPHDYFLENLSADSTYKIFISSSQGFNFVISQCPYPRGATLSGHKSYPFEIDLEFEIDEDIPLEGFYDIYYDINPLNAPDITTLPTLSNIELINGKLTISGSPDQTYDLYFRSVCNTGASIWVGPFEVSTDVDCGQYQEDFLQANTTGTTAWIRYTDSIAGDMNIIYRDSFFERPSYEDTQQGGFITNGKNWNSDTTGTFIYRLEPHTEYTYYLKSQCNGSQPNSQPWQGPFTFSTDGSSFVKPEEVYCSQCFRPGIDNTVNELLPEIGGARIDLFPRMTPYICDGNNYDEITERVYRYKALETTTIELRGNVSVFCSFSTRFLTQFFIRSASEPFGLDGWEYLGCLEESTPYKTLNNEVFIEVEKDSVYYILADIYGDMCDASQGVYATMELIGDCSNPCAQANNLMATDLGSGMQEVTWDEVPGALGYQFKVGRSKLTHASNCEFFTPPSSSLNTSYTINVDSLITIYGEDQPLSAYVKIFCNDETYSRWEEVSLTPHIAFDSEFITLHTLGICNPVYNRGTTAEPENVFYDKMEFSVSMSGLYYFETQVYSALNGAYAAIYEDSFDPLLPTENLILVHDSEGEFNSNFEINLEVGKVYIYVASNSISNLLASNQEIKSRGPANLDSEGFVYLGIEESAHGVVPPTDGTIYQSNNVCRDANGWRHYYYADSNNINGEDYLLFSVEDYPDISDYFYPFDAMSGGSSGTSLIVNPPADYVSLENGWLVMNRYWDFDVPFGAQPDSLVPIRFYYTVEDLEAMQSASGNPLLAHEDLNFMKINDSFDSYDLDPVNGHEDIIAALTCNARGAWEYDFGAESDSITWSLGTHGDAFYAEMEVHAFSGGGGGVGSFRALIDADEDGFDSTVDCDDDNPDIYPGADEIPNNGIDEDCDGQDLTTAIVETSRGSVEVFPNPTKDKVFIKVKGMLNGRYRMVDVSGKILLDGVLSTDTVLDLTSYNNGVYNLVIYTDNKVITRRIVKM